jgi:BirA family biotin operon repressor/biotin-[acetyl-CoA-carboxylase] ligase
MQHDHLTPEAIRHNLGTSEIPRRVLCYARASSTMDVARAHLNEQPADAFPLLVQADEQTAGRGRMRRPWASAPGTSLLFSLVLRPQWHFPPDDAAMLVWLAGVSLCEGIASMTPLQPRLKWPNDVLLPLPAQLAQAPVGMGKIAGILLESSSSQAGLTWAIIGCGLNVSDSPPPDAALRYPATNLAAALGQPVPRLPLLRAILTRLDFWYAHLRRGDHGPLFETWRSLLHSLGQHVVINLPDGVLEGTAEAVDRSGALHVRDAAGTLHAVTNGDVSG